MDIDKEDIRNRDSLWDLLLPIIYSIPIPTTQEIRDNLLIEKNKGNNRYLGKPCNKCGKRVRIITYNGKVSLHTNECFICESVRKSKRHTRIRDMYNKLCKDDQEIVDSIYAQATYLSYININNIKYEVHHIILIADGGTHNPSNLIILTETEHKKVHALLYAIKKKKIKDYQNCLNIILMEGQHEKI